MSRGLSEKANRISSSDPWKNGQSVGWSQTVRLLADCPILCCGLSETSSNENEDEQEHDEHTKNSPSRGPSATSSRTVRAS
jgi:hypothetical protein